jgi:NO-binding membrane sensor protein with MHYT domain
MVITYQPILVLLSIGVAIVGSLTSLVVTSGVHDEIDGEPWESAFALANGGLIMGTTIWSMHFIAMMAVQVPVLVNYNIVETIMSIGIAIAVTAAGLFVVSGRRWGILSVPGAGLLMGLGIGAMHYLGMSAIRGCGLVYDPALVGASIAIAVVASNAALWFAFYKRSIAATVVGGVVQGLAIASMHYTGMAATGYIRLDGVIGLTFPLFSQNLLAYMIAGAMLVVCTGNLALFGAMSAQQKRMVGVRSGTGLLARPARGPDQQPPPLSGSALSRGRAREGV